MGPLAIKDFVPKTVFSDLAPMKANLINCQNRFKKELAVIVRVQRLYNDDVVIGSDESVSEVTVLRELAAKLAIKHPLRLLAEGMHRRVSLGQKVFEDDSDKDIAPMIYAHTRPSFIHSSPHHFPFL